MKNELDGIIKYTDRNGEIVQATIINYFQIGNEKYIFYTKENLNNKKENDSIALSIANYDEEKKTLSKIEIQDNQNMALNVATIIGNYSSDGDIDLDALNKKVSVFDFKMLPLSQLFNESIIEEEGIVQKMAPYRYVKNMKDICDKASQKIQQIESTNVESKPEVVDASVEEQLEEPVIINSEEDSIRQIEQIDEEIKKVEEEPQIVNYENIVVDDETIKLLEELAVEMKKSDEEMGKRVDEKTKITKDNIMVEMDKIVEKYISELNDYRNEIEVERSKKQDKIFEELSEKFVQPLLEQVSKVSTKTKLLAEENVRYKVQEKEYHQKETELNKTIVQQREEMDSQALQISDLQTRLDDEKVANSSHVESIKTRDEEIRKKDKIIETKDEDYAILQREAEELKNQISKLNSDASMSEQLHKKDMEAKDEEIKLLRQQSEVDKNTINSQTTMITNKNNEIRNLTDQLKEASQREFAIKQAFGFQGPEVSPKIVK